MKKLSIILIVCLMFNLATLVNGQESGVFTAQAAITKSTAPFTYTGDWEIVEYQTGKYYAKLLTSGILTPKSNATIDVFLVGGGGAGDTVAGGGGGYTASYFNRILSAGTGVSVTVGQGGDSQTWVNDSSMYYFGNGDATSFGSLTVSGGRGGQYSYNSGGTTSSSSWGYGGAGGSGGGGGGHRWNGNSSLPKTPGAGGQDGSDGTGGTMNYLAHGSKGVGQGSTTRAFNGDSYPFNTSEFLFSNGGGAAVTQSSTNGNGGTVYPPIPRSGSNTGDGGGSPGNVANAWTAANGSSGIVIIRGNSDVAPTAPAGITIPNPITYNTAYTVSWSAATSSSGTLAGYRLERQINGGTWTQVYQGTATSFSQTLTRGQATTVSYRVKAYSTGGLESGYTTGTTVTVINNRIAMIPTIATQPAASVDYWNTTNLTWTWNASSDADGDSLYYAVERQLNGNGSWVQVATGLTGRTYTHSINSASDTSVQIRVRAYDTYSGTNNYSGYLTSAIVSIRYDKTPPTLTLTANPASGWTGGNVTITAVMTNALSPLDKIVAPSQVSPTGTITLSGNSSTQTFTVPQNGTYSFVVYNKAGLSTSKSITVSNIDKSAPTISATVL